MVENADSTVIGDRFEADDVLWLLLPPCVLLLAELAELVGAVVLAVAVFVAVLLMEEAVVVMVVVVVTAVDTRAFSPHGSPPSAPWYPSSTLCSSSLVELSWIAPSSSVPSVVAVPCRCPNPDKHRRLRA